MTDGPRILGALLAIAALAAMVRASSTPVTVHDGTHGVLRLAWSARPERIETCRELSDEELARLPQHMRQPVRCEGASAEYRMTVRNGRVVLADRIVRGGGLRRDRRLYVFQELPLEPGEASLDVRFDRVGGDSPAPSAAPDTGPAVAPGPAPQQPGAESVPAHLLFQQRTHVRPGEVILVTYAPERRALVAIQPEREQTP